MRVLFILSKKVRRVLHLKHNLWLQFTLSCAEGGCQWRSLCSCLFSDRFLTESVLSASLKNHVKLFGDYLFGCEAQRGLEMKLLFIQSGLKNYTWKQHQIETRLKM